MAKSSARLDKLLVDRGLAETRERAQSLVLAAKVLVNGQILTKAGHKVPEDSDIQLIGEEIPYVSRGGLKLEHAIPTFSIDIAGRIAMDVGASTGGFTDCLLQHGAAKVIAEWFEPRQRALAPALPVAREIKGNHPQQATEQRVEQRKRTSQVTDNRLKRQWTHVQRTMGCIHPGLRHKYRHEGQQ